MGGGGGGRMLNVGGNLRIGNEKCEKIGK